MHVVDSDLKRITGKGMDEAEESEFRKLLAEYNRYLKEGSINSHINGARHYLIDYRKNNNFKDLLKLKAPRKQHLPNYLVEDEAAKLIKAADCLRDKLIFELLWETGCMPRELLNLRIKDIQFDEYSAVIQLSGKTGDRIGRVFIGKPDLQEYVNHHPKRDDPTAHLIVTEDVWHKPLKPGSLRKMVRV